MRLTSTCVVLAVLRPRAGRHDGGNDYRDMVFDAACGCLAYTGPVRRTL